MLTAHNITKSYGTQTILQDISFSIQPKERVGLIGPNGCGKTTLLRILAGGEQPDSGHVALNPPDLRLGYLEQGFSLQFDIAFGELLNRASGDLAHLEQELVRLAHELAIRPEKPDLQEAYDDVLNRLETAVPDRYQLSSLLNHLGLEGIPAGQPVETLSGGQKTRLALAMVLLKGPQALLLDEPTNHLDIQMLEWLEDWLADFQGAALIVSHDRTFLDRTVNHILDLNPNTHQVKAYPGNYTDYLHQYRQEVEQQWQIYKDQEAETRRIRQDIARTKEQARWVEITTTSRQPNVRRYARKVARKALAREKKLNRFLTSEDRVEKPERSWQMNIEFAPEVESGKDVLHLDNLSIGYPDIQPLLTNINLSLWAGERVVLTGPNGCGKTTLLRTIAGQLQPVEGSIRLGANVHLGYMAQEQEVLNPELSALETLQAIAPMNETDARNFLHFFLFAGDKALQPVNLLSYGERARLILATLVAQGCNLLLLDEPINHLDIPSRERFEQALATFDGTVIAVVHDRYFIEQFASRLWLVEDAIIEKAL
ncbi:MAG: ABC-F family ATP-binding cassette domain-containing protein [Anaerolineales bacterium]|nr:ABC-F family ATP-binding cassette domain-containing protein [Anaerolineales bacterium]